MDAVLRRGGEQLLFGVDLPARIGVSGKDTQRESIDIN
jgi:hypothetical protein